MATLGKSWTEVSRGSQSKTYSGFTVTVVYILEAKLTSQSTENNRSYIDTRARVEITNNLSSYGVTYSCTGCTTWSSTAAGWDPYTIKTETAVSGSTTVNHNASGKGSLSMSGAMTASGMGYSISVSGSIDLPTIPRQSKITVFNNFTIEDGLSFTYKDDLANKALTLRVAIGSTNILTKSYTSAVGSHTDSITFTQAQLNTIYGLVPTNSKKVKFTLTLSTAGISTTSTAEANGALKESLNSPTVSDFSIVEMTSVVTDTIILRYISKKKISVSASAVNGATIASVAVTNGNVTEFATYDSSTQKYSVEMTNLTSNTFVVTATDSRGFSDTLTDSSCTLLLYSYPVVTQVEFDRLSNITTEGYCSATGQFWNGELSNTLQIQITVSDGSTNHQWYLSQSDITCQDNTWSFSNFSIPLGTLLRDRSYTCRVIVLDSYGQSSTYIASIGIARRALWLGKYTIRAEGTVTEHLVIRDPNTETEVIVGGYKDVGTYTNETYYGVGGYITSGGNAAVLNIPVGLIGFNNITINTLLCSLRVVSGTYLGGNTTNIDLTQYIDTNSIEYIPTQQMLRLILRNSNGWNITNNTPLFGDVILSYTISSN